MKYFRTNPLICAKGGGLFKSRSVKWKGKGILTVLTIPLASRGFHPFNEHLIEMRIFLLSPLQEVLANSLMEVFIS